MLFFFLFLKEFLSIDFNSMSTVWAYFMRRGYGILYIYIYIIKNYWTRLYDIKYPNLIKTINKDLSDLLLILP